MLKVSEEQSFQEIKAQSKEKYKMIAIRRMEQE